MAAPPPVLPVIVQENWAQCENPNCNKWRRLPPAHKVDEEEPWYCYLNPNQDKATCSASEDVSASCCWGNEGVGLEGRRRCRYRSCCRCQRFEQPDGGSPTGRRPIPLCRPPHPLLQDFNEATMVEIGPGTVNDEAEQSRLIRERLTASLLASTSGAAPAVLPQLPYLPPAPASGGRSRGRGKGCVRVGRLWEQWRAVGRDVGKTNRLPA